MRKDSRSSPVSSMLAELACSTVIVEGKHDVDALASLGIIAFTEGSIRRNGIKGSKAYILMDSDRRGYEREERMRNLLLEMDDKMKIDTALGKRLQKMLSITSIEQLRTPALRAMKQ